MSETDLITQQVEHLTNEEIRNRIKMFENNLKQYKLENNKINHDMKKV